MKRRSYLALAGVGALGALAGCMGDDGDGSGSGSGGGPGDSGSTDTTTDGGAPFEHPGTLDEPIATNGDYPNDQDPADGFGPSFDAPPEAPDVDPSTFETLEVNGETIRLVPIDVAYDWYRRQDARFVDARGLGSYVEAHAYGAVLSTYQSGSTGGGIEGWDADGRVVTYCTCPHHMSTVRAAGLQKAGFSDVYAIDEGFRPWYQGEYPMAGSSFRDTSQASVSEWTIAGTVPAEYAGETVRVATGQQYEAGPIAADGRYELHLRFWNVDEETPIQLRTPKYTITRTLGELASGTVEAPGTF